MSQSLADQRLRTIAEHMTPAPVSIGRRTLVSAAKELMAQRHVRHLPVVEMGEVAGLLNEHDLDGAPPDAVVEDMMMRDPLVVAPTASVSEVAHDLLKRGHRCVLVAAGRTLVGIFTSADALALLDHLDRVHEKTRLAPTCDRWGHILRQ